MTLKKRLALSAAPLLVLFSQGVYGSGKFLEDENLDKRTNHKGFQHNTLERAEKDKDVNKDKILLNRLNDIPIEVSDKQALTLFKGTVKEIKNNNQQLISKIEQSQYQINNNYVPGFCYVMWRGNAKKYIDTVKDESEKRLENINIFENMLYDVEQTISIKNKEIEDKTQELKNLKEENEIFLLKDKQYKKNIEKYDQNEKQLKSNIDDLQTKLEFSKREHYQINQAHQETKSKLENDLRHLQDQLKKERDFYAETQENLKTAKEEILELKGERTRVQLDLEKLFKENGDLKKIGKDITDQFLNLEHNGEVLKKEKGLLFDQITTLKEELKQKNTFIKKGEDYVERLKHENYVLKEKEKESKTLTDQLEGLETKLKILQEHIKQKENDADKQEETIKTLKLEASQKQERLNLLEKESGKETQQLDFVRLNLMSALSLLGQSPNSSDTDDLFKLSSNLVQLIGLKFTQNK